MTNPYPSIQNFDAYRSELAPNQVYREPAGAYAAAWTAWWPSLELSYEDVAAALTDARTTGGDLLTALAAQVGEERGGLTDDELLRILDGRFGAAWGRGTLAGIVAMWTGLSGVGEDRISIRTEGVDGYVILRALIDYTPSTQFLARARRVVQDAAAYGYDVTSTLYVSGSLQWGKLPGWGVGTWPYQIS